MLGFFMVLRLLPKAGTTSPMNLQQDQPWDDKTGSGSHRPLPVWRTVTGAALR